MKECQTKEECIKNICRFPEICAEFCDYSPLEIVKKLQYLEFRREIKKDEIIKELNSDDKIIVSWLNFTEDKRWTPAWGISKDNTLYSVFYISPSGEIEINQQLTDPYEACAILIRMEMEGLVK